MGLSSSVRRFSNCIYRLTVCCLGVSLVKTLHPSSGISLPERPPALCCCYDEECQNRPPPSVFFHPGLASKQPSKPLKPGVPGPPKKAPRPPHPATRPRSKRAPRPPQIPELRCSVSTILGGSKTFGENGRIGGSVPGSRGSALYNRA